MERSYCETTKRGCELQVECNAVVFNHARTVNECVAQTGCAAFTPAQLTELGVALDPVAIDACIDALDGLSCDGVAACDSASDRALRRVSA